MWETIKGNYNSLIVIEKKVLSKMYGSTYKLETGHLEKDLTLKYGDLMEDKISPCALEVRNLVTKRCI